MNSKEQAIEIARLVNQIRDYLKKPSTVDFYRANESLGAALVSSTAGIKSRPMILYGLKAVVETTTNFLPTNEELLAGRVQAWLSPGDIITGWVDYFADQPRVIVAVELGGYKWRWFNDDENMSRGPGEMKTDPWLSSYGWIKPEGTTLEEIEAEQANEIAQLAGLLDYFRNKEFLN
jgi:hypothetical protein